MKKSISNIPIEINSEKSFGIVFALVFFIIALYPIIDSKGIQMWALITSFIFFILSFLFPRIFYFPNRLWFNFGLFLGSIIAPIIMALIYFMVFFPTGLIMRILGKDLLKKKLDDKSQSYWIKRDQPVGTMKNQF